LGALAGAAGLGAAGVYGSTSAQAQASGPAGQQGTASAPNDMFAYNLDVQNGAQFNGTDLVGVGALETDDLTHTTGEGLPVNAGAYDTLQDAVDAAGDGARIYIPNGTYSRVDPLEAQTLIAESHDVLIDGGDSVGVFVSDTEPDVTLIGITAQNDAGSGSRVVESRGAPNVRFIDINILGGGSDGLAFTTGADGSLMRGCRVQSTGGDEIRVTADNCSVESCIVEGTISNGGTNNSIGDANVTY
jgi:hypothetical protein